MCNSSFKESVDGIKLDKIEVKTFEDFMLWLHSYIPSTAIEKEFPAVVELAIFADYYQILPLKNQTSDIILQSLLDNQSLVTPEVISWVYGCTPDGSVLRRHFCLAFCTLHDTVPKNQFPTPRNEFMSIEKLPEWDAVFLENPRFGLDYFRNTRNPTKTEFPKKKKMLFIPRP